MSSVDILTVLLFHEIDGSDGESDFLDLDELDEIPSPQGSSSPLQRKGDKLIVSNAQIAPLLYAAQQLKSDSSLPFTLNPSSSELSFLAAPTGSLGQGLSIANGYALSSKVEGQENSIFVLMGDGELQAGQVWEAAMTAAHHKLSTVCAIVDCNGSQREGTLVECKNIEPLLEKWRAFGWDAIEVNGHSVGDLMRAFSAAKKLKEKPSVILAKTVKGKGVFSLEHVLGYGSTSISAEDADRAIEAMTPLEE